MTVITKNKQKFLIDLKKQINTRKQFIGTLEERFRIMKKDCSHEDENGKNIIEDEMFMSCCPLCGWNDF